MQRERGNIISLAKLARELEVTDEAIRKRLRAGRFPEAFLYNGRTCFNMYEVEEYLKKYPMRAVKINF